MFICSKFALRGALMAAASWAMAGLGAAFAGQNPLVPTALKTIPISPSTAGSIWPAVNTKTNRVYVANLGASFYDQYPGGASVTVIDSATDTIIDTIPIPVIYTNLYTPPGPSQIAIDDDTNTLYVLTNHGAIAVVDGATDAVTSYFIVDTNMSGVDPFSTRAIVRSRKTGKLYVSLSTVEIDVIDPEKQTVLKRIPNLAAGPLSIDQSLNRIYTSANSPPGTFNGVMVIDGDSDEVKTIIPTFAYGLEGSAVDEELHHLYILGEGNFTPSESNGGFVTIDTKTDTVINSTNAWASAYSGYGVDIDPVNHGVYALSDLSSLLTVVDGRTGQPVAYNIQIGPQYEPQNLAVNWTNGKIYVADFGLGAYPQYGSPAPSEIFVLQLPGAN
ncbi:MAG TPA: hypothetical protein VK446_10095 [Methylocystis sp.]|nr:hypothetical protein [Methylocystis sp.]